MKKSFKVFISKKTDNWKTPSKIYNHFISNGFYDLTPYTEEEINELTNGLNKFVDKNIFINPPFTQLKDFIEHCIFLHRLYKKRIIMLLPNRSETKAFQLLYEYGVKITIIYGRLKYSDYKSAPFPSVYVELIGDGKLYIDTIKGDNDYKL